MEMQQIIPCQIAYALAGFIFNFESWRRLKSGESQLTATEPIRGMLTMLIVAAVTVSYFFAGMWIYSIGWTLIILRVMPSGVLRHIKSVAWNGDYSNYASPRTAYAALFINMFGVCVGLLGIFESFVFD